MLELKLKHIGTNEERDPNFTTWNFIVAQEGSCLGFYAEDAHETGKCRFVAERHSIPKENVLGGATLGYTYGHLIFMQESIEFGPVPESAAKSVADEIRESLRGRYPVEKISFELGSRMLSPEMKSRWEESGYSF